MVQQAQGRSCHNWKEQEVASHSKVMANVSRQHPDSQGLRNSPTPDGGRGIVIKAQGYVTLSLGAADEPCSHRQPCP